MSKLKEGDIVEYYGNYDNCHGIEYVIKYVYEFMHYCYYDMQRIDEHRDDIVKKYSSYKELLSVPCYEVKLKK